MGYIYLMAGPSQFFLVYGGEKYLYHERDSGKGVLKRAAVSHD